MSGTELSGTRAWLAAARPQTLPAAAAPIVVGGGLAWADGVFAFGPLRAMRAFLTVQSRSLPFFGSPGE